MNPFIAWLIVLFVALAVWAGFAAILAALVVAFAATPSFWVAFWLVLVALIALSSAASGRVTVQRRRRR